MATSIHPHKGYLNTKFQFHVTGHDSLDYEIVTASNETQRMFYGKVSPNEPFGHTIPIAGNFKIKFSDGSIIPITVEDGYKFGGGKFKDAFVFDNCPWAFIIMHDRTYFYNRDTEEAYLETVSPDKITEINENYVLFESKCQEKYTIYSLDEQKPILCVSDIRFFNEEILVWCEEIDNTTKLFFYSVNEQEIKKEVDFDQYVVDKKNQRIIYSKSSQVISISLNINLYTSILKETFQGELVCMKAPNLAISYESTKNGNYLYAYDLDSDTLLKKITVHGYLSSIENNKLIDLWIRKQDIRNFDIKMYVCPEAVVIADYEEFVFYPCNCDVFYSVKHIQLKKSVTEPLSIKEEYSIHSCGFEIDQSIDCHFQSMATYGSCVCLYNSNTSFVFDKRLSRSIYSDNGKIYQEDGRIYRYVDSTLYILDTDGNWVDGKKHSYDFQYFEQFCIVIDNESKYVYKLNGQNLGKWECANYINTPFIKTSDYCILPQAKFVKSYRSSLPQYYSFDLGYGIKVTGEEVHFYTLINGQYSKTQILTDLFDSSQYKNVLFSEDGQYIMHRDGHQTVVMDVVHETVDIYNNLSYVEHINGIRPLFETPTSFQPRLIDPVTRQTIDCKRITQYQFISPDKRLYADTRLEEYVEHYYKDDGNILTREEYKYLLEKYEYPCGKEKDSDEWNRIIELRKQFILKHIDCLDKDTKEMICKDDTYCNWEIKILDTINKFDVKRFLSLVIGERGMAYIRKTLMILYLLKFHWVSHLALLTTFLSHIIPDMFL